MSIVQQRKWIREIVGEVFSTRLLIFLFTGEGSSGFCHRCFSFVFVSSLFSFSSSSSSSRLIESWISFFFFIGIFYGGILKTFRKSEFWESPDKHFTRIYWCASKKISNLRMENLERRRESNAIIFKILDLSKWCLSKSKKNRFKTLRNCYYYYSNRSRGGIFHATLGNCIKSRGRNCKICIWLNLPNTKCSEFPYKSTVVGTTFV